MGEKALHVLRMVAWGMFDIEALPKRERGVRLRQIRLVLAEHGMQLQVGFQNKYLAGGTTKPWYNLHRATCGYVLCYDNLVESSPSIGEICVTALRIIEPSNPER